MRPRLLTIKAAAAPALALVLPGGILIGCGSSSDSAATDAPTITRQAAGSAYIKNVYAVVNDYCSQAGNVHACSLADGLRCSATASDPRECRYRDRIRV